MRSTVFLKYSEERENNLNELNLICLECQQLLAKCKILELTNLSESDKAQYIKITNELEAKTTLLEKMKGELVEDEKQFQSTLVESFIPEIESVRGTKYTESEMPIIRQFLHQHRNIKEVDYYFRKRKEAASMDEEYINDWSFIINSVKYRLVKAAELFLIQQVSNYSIPASYRANELTNEDVNAVMTPVEKVSNSLMTLFSRSLQTAEEPDSGKRISPPGPGRKQDH